MKGEIKKPESIYRYSLVACARWEEKDIIEWIEYHRSIGFQHFYIYSNDDDAEVLREVLRPYFSGDDPVVTYSYWPQIGDQIGIYTDFLRRFKGQTDWACFLDIDEFIVLKNSNDIDGFIRGREQETDCVYLNWLYYGHNGKTRRDGHSVLTTLTRRSRTLDPHTKTIFRTRKVSEAGAIEGMRQTGVPFIHFWNRYPFENFRMCDAVGRDVSRYADDFPTVASTLSPRREGYALHHRNRLHRSLRLQVGG